MRAPATHCWAARGVTDVSRRVGAEGRKFVRQAVVTFVHACTGLFFLDALELDLQSALAVAAELNPVGSTALDARISRGTVFRDQQWTDLLESSLEGVPPPLLHDRHPAGKGLEPSQWCSRLQRLRRPMSRVK